MNHRHYHYAYYFVFYWLFLFLNEHELSIKSKWVVSHEIFDKYHNNNVEYCDEIKNKSLILTITQYLCLNLKLIFLHYVFNVIWSVKLIRHSQHWFFHFLYTWIAQIYVITSMLFRLSFLSVLGNNTMPTTITNKDQTWACSSQVMKSSLASRPQYTF